LDEDAHGGIAANSVVAFVVRPGNPKHIHGWNDLTSRSSCRDAGSVLRLGEVERPRRLRSGARSRNEQTRSQARHEPLQERRLAAIVRLNAASAFFSGQGDVLITYESEAYAAFAAGSRQARRPEADDADPAADGGNQDAPRAAKAFIKYVHAPKQQKIFGQRLPAGREVGPEER
jgi:sulfate transport system substrate-binding protein